MNLGITKNKICSVCNNRSYCFPEENFSSQSMEAEQFDHRPLKFLIKDHYIFKQGDKADDAYCVYHGKVKIFNDNKEIAIANTGDFVGYNSIVDGYYINSALTLEKTFFCTFELTEMEQLITNHKPVAEKILIGY